MRSLPPSLPRSLAPLRKSKFFFRMVEVEEGVRAERERERESERVYPSPSDPGEGERQSGANVIAEDKKVRGEMYSYVTCRYEVQSKSQPPPSDCLERL